MNRRAESLVHTIGEVKHKIELLEGYLAWLHEELAKEVNKNEEIKVWEIGDYD